MYPELSRIQRWCKERSVPLIKEGLSLLPGTLGWVGRPFPLALLEPGRVRDTPRQGELSAP